MPICCAQLTEMKGSFIILINTAAIWLEKILIFSCVYPDGRNNDIYVADHYNCIAASYPVQLRNVPIVAGGSPLSGTTDGVCCPNRGQDVKYVVCESLIESNPPKWASRYQHCCLCKIQIFGQCMQFGSELSARYLDIISFHRSNFGTITALDSHPCTISLRGASNQHQVCVSPTFCHCAILLPLAAFTCIQPKQPIQDATQPTTPRWWFNSITGTCELFAWEYGAQINVSPNNFQTIEHCQTFCGESEWRGGEHIWNRWTIKFIAQCGQVTKQQHHFFYSACRRGDRESTGVGRPLLSDEKVKDHCTTLSTDCGPGYECTTIGSLQRCCPPISKWRDEGISRIKPASIAYHSTIELHLQPASAAR